MLSPTPQQYKRPVARARPIPLAVTAASIFAHYQPEFNAQWRKEYGALPPPAQEQVAVYHKMVQAGTELESKGPVHATVCRIYTVFSKTSVFHNGSAESKRAIEKTLENCFSQFQDDRQRFKAEFKKTWATLFQYKAMQPFEVPDDLLDRMHEYLQQKDAAVGFFVYLWNNFDMIHMVLEAMRLSPYLMEHYGVAVKRALLEMDQKRLVLSQQCFEKRGKLIEQMTTQECQTFAQLDRFLLPYPWIMAPHIYANKKAYDEVKRSSMDLV